MEPLPRLVRLSAIGLHCEHALVVSSSGVLCAESVGAATGGCSLEQLSLEGTQLLSEPGSLFRRARDELPAGGVPLVVLDARADDAARDWPPVHASHVSCFVGLPLRASSSSAEDATVLGVVGVFSSEPRTVPFTVAELDAFSKCPKLVPLGGSSSGSLPEIGSGGEVPSLRCRTHNW